MQDKESENNVVSNKDSGAGGAGGVRIIMVSNKNKDLELGSGARIWSQGS